MLGNNFPLKEIWTEAEATFFTVKQARQEELGRGSLSSVVTPLLFGHISFLTARGVDAGLLPAFSLLLCSFFHSIHNSLLPISSPSQVLAWGSICLGAAEAPLLTRPPVTPQEWDSVQSALAHLDEQTGVGGWGGCGRQRASCSRAASISASQKLELFG